jgi:hypothetical protein
MGIRDWLNPNPSSKFLDGVEAEMRGSIRVPDEVMRSFGNEKMIELIERSRRKGESVDVVALRTFVGIYTSYILGNDDQRSLANRMYMPLKMHVGNAELGGEISSQEAEYCDELIGNAFRESALKYGLGS